MREMNISPNKPRPSFVERRSGVDRRVRDVAMAQGRDRRRGVEPRKPEVIEILPSDSVWASFELDQPEAGKAS